MTNPTQDFMPDAYLRALAQATEQGHLTMTIIVTPETITNLTQGKADILHLEDGGVVILVPQVAVEKAYGWQSAPGSTRSQSKKQKRRKS